MKIHHALFIPLFAQLPGCDANLSENWTQPINSVLEDIRNKGKLIVLTRNAPTTYFHENDKEQGFEYELTRQLAESLKIEVEYKVYNTNSEVMAALAAGEGHIAAAGLTRTEQEAEYFQFGPSYKTVNQLVACNRHIKLPKTNRDLPKYSLLVIADSRNDEKLTELQAELPALSWQTTRDLSTEQVLKKVAQGEVDCTLVASNIMAINRIHHPDLIKAYTLSEEKLAWALPGNASHLEQYIETWFKQIKSDSTFTAINERYYGHAEIFDYYDTSVFLQRVKKRLPKYKAFFKQVANTYKIPWTLLATQAYQESHWDPLAASPTGVRGLMMLTEDTAKTVGVQNRLNPKQSIIGGAKYLQQLLRKIPKEVAEEDRIWFALAAYNIGYAHLLDARALARKSGKNPNVWADIKQVLPLLAQRRYFKNLKYGYARGKEPVQYINRIRLYHDVLTKTVSSKAI
ncbi:MAG: membrane-bound lytic murein transglycosylase MltF [Gammaproteobacteria bacterium HGW-Gammaproteobacteria-3]|nr:MAG: membrane-bound lytic murein transglycosylase MltF [Gammaproteobacteria bacterium HGW-Gammaproteobacteria-3]